MSSPAPWTRALAALVAAALGGCGTQAAEPATSGKTGTLEHRMKFDRIEYLVAVMPQAPETLNLAASGAVRYASHSNAGSPDRPEIGVYEWTAPAADLAGLDAALGGLAALPDHAGRILSGDRFREVSVTAAAEVTTKAVGTHEPVDARLLAILNQLDALAAKTAEHPRQVLAVDVSDVVFGADGVLTLSLVLTGRGTQSVVCRSPVALVDAPDGWVSIQLWPDVQVQSLGAGDILRAKAARAEDQRKPPSFDATLELAPGASASFRVQAKLPDAKPGPSVVRLSYASFAEGGSGRPLLAGEVLSKKVKIAVPRRGGR